MLITTFKLNQEGFSNKHDAHIKSRSELPGVIVVNQRRPVSKYILTQSRKEEFETTDFRDGTD